MQGGLHLPSSNSVRWIAELLPLPKNGFRPLALFLGPVSYPLERVVVGVGGVFEVADDGAPGFAALVDVAFGDGADTAGRGGGEVDDVLGVEAHEAGGGGVDGGGVVADEEDAGVLGRAHDGAVAFHA